MELNELLKTRRTIRKFNQKPIPDEILQEILESQRYASSAANLQHLKFVAAKSPELVEQVFAHTRWAGYLPKEVGTPREGEHPTLFIAVTADKTTPWTGMDAGLAVSNMTLTAWNHGIASCILGSFDKEAVKDILGITSDIQSLVAFGYPAMEAKVVDMDGDIKYYIDEAGTNCVPKRPLKDTVTIL